MPAMVAQRQHVPKALIGRGLLVVSAPFGTIGAMVEPRVIPRAEHTLSRSDVDPDALKVLYRLRQGDHIAYLVGGSVRDLLLGRRPKDFDIGTSAHPYQVKKLFRNCWIIGRRFRLAHVRFGSKVIEVATFRRQIQPGEEIVEDGVPAPDRDQLRDLEDGTAVSIDFRSDDDQRRSQGLSAARADAQLIHRDNTFGTPEEDAFRRDFTINALFYDIATFSVIDYVGGLDDLRAGIVRSIGNPETRFQEDPVRMLRAIALAARLDFTIDQPIVDAIRVLRHQIANSSAPRLLEEYYKILRAGSSEKTFRGLADAGLIEPISHELHHGADENLWESLRSVDEYRAKFTSTPETLTNAVLLGSLLVPLGLAPQPGRGPARRDDEGRPREPLARLGNLPLARRDLERLRQILALQRRLRDLSASVRAQRGLTHRSVFREALTWMEIHGGMPEVVEHWITVLAERGAEEPVAEVVPEGDRPRRRRRRRRRRYRPAQ
jgi:poly(A) polymerase